MFILWIGILFIFFGGLFFYLDRNLSIDFNLPEKLGLSKKSNFFIVNLDNGQVVIYRKGKVTEEKLEINDFKLEEAEKVRKATEVFGAELVSHVLSTIFEDLPDEKVKKVGEEAAKFIVSKSIGDYLTIEENIKE